MKPLAWAILMGGALLLAGCQSAPGATLQVPVRFLVGHDALAAPGGAMGARFVAVVVAPDGRSFDAKLSIVPGAALHVDELMGIVNEDAAAHDVTLATGSEAGGWAKEFRLDAVDAQGATLATLDLTRALDQATLRLPEHAEARLALTLTAGEGVAGAGAPLTVFTSVR